MQRVQLVGPRRNVLLTREARGQKIELGELLSVYAELIFFYFFGGFSGPTVYVRHNIVEFIKRWDFKGLYFLD